MNKEFKGFILIIFIFAFLVRFDFLMLNKDFWHDEAFQYLYSEKPVKFIIDSNDVHPPLFNLFTKLLLKFNIDNIFYLRFIILIISMGFLVAFFFTIKELFNDYIAIISTGMISFSYTFLYYSIEFRNYMFVLLFTILQIYMFNKLLDEDRVLHWYIILSLIIVYSHYLAGFIILIQILYFLIDWDAHSSDVKAEVITGWIMTALLSIPLLLYLLKTLPKIQSFWFKDIGIRSLLSTFSYILSPPSDFMVYGFATFYLFLFTTLIYFKLYRDKKYIQFFMYLFLPIIIMWSLSQFYPFYHHRYFLFGGMSFFVLIGIGAEKLDKKIPDMGLYILAIWIVLFMGNLWCFQSEQHHELFDAGLFIYNETNNATDDFIMIHSSTFSQSPFKVYFEGFDNYLYTNLSRQQLFSAGGSVVEDYEIIRDLSELDNISSDKYAVSNKIIYDTVIYSEGGLIITKK